MRRCLWRSPVGHPESRKKTCRSLTLLGLPYDIFIFKLFIQVWALSLRAAVATSAMLLAQMPAISRNGVTGPTSGAVARAVGALRVTHGYLTAKGTTAVASKDSAPLPQ